VLMQLLTKPVVIVIHTAIHAPSGSTLSKEDQSFLRTPFSLSRINGARCGEQQADFSISYYLCT
jgi:hypothetical protein